MTRRGCGERGSGTFREAAFDQVEALNTLQREHELKPAGALFGKQDVAMDFFSRNPSSGLANWTVPFERIQTSLTMY